MGKAKRQEHTFGRRSAASVLYQSEIIGKPVDRILEEGDIPEEAGLNEYGRLLLLGFSAHRAEIDRIISERSANWAVNRMPMVDRELLRITVYEMKYVDAVPIPVSINEAVEIAKEFGGDDSYRFINGLLGRVARDLDEQASGSGSDSDAASAPDDAASAEPAESPAADGSEDAVESEPIETVEGTAATAEPEVSAAFAADGAASAAPEVAAVALSVED